MKATVTKPVEVEIETIKIKVAVRYDEDDMPNDFPFRDGESWNITVGMDTGIIQDWPDGVTHSLHMKVCDCGSYFLKDSEGIVVGSIENNYVPHGVVPGDYGDYLVFDIESNGRITQWPDSPDVSAFFSQDA